MMRSNSNVDPNSAEAKALSFRCFNANFGSDANWPHPGTGPLDTVELPKKACAGGIRGNIFFPSSVSYSSNNISPPLISTIIAAGMVRTSTCPTTTYVSHLLIYMPSS